MKTHEILYIHNESVHNTKAAQAFLPYLFDIIKPNSVLDVGCGIGTWLKVLNRAGVERILGIDGEYVDTNNLHIDILNFIGADLRKKIDLKEKFDLVISLEVAEHLPSSSAEQFISTLTQHSDVILFSAALKGQGGQHHLNEQSFDYWVHKFNERGYVVLDLFRNRIWNNDSIDWWYRQNTFLVVNQNNQLATKFKQTKISDFYHPIPYLNLVQERDMLVKDYLNLSAKLEAVMSGKKGVRISFSIVLNALRLLVNKLFAKYGQGEKSNLK